MNAVRRIAGELVERYDRANLRARVLGCVTAAAAIGLAVDALWIRPLGEEHDRLEAQVASAQAQVDANRNALALPTDAGVRREVEALRHAIGLERAKIARANESVESRLTGFVDPRDARTLLVEMLRRHPGMKLVSAEISAGAPLLAAADAESADDHGSTLFKHAIRIELEGGYLESLSYLRELEGAEWKLAWDRLDYEVLEYPKGRLVLELHTVSAAKEWLGA